MKYRHFQPYFVVKNGIHGRGIFVTTNIKKGTLLFKLEGEILDHPTRTSIQIGKNQHIEDVIGGFINHSCLPSAKVSRKKRAFISLRDINKGEEITFDYNKNEDQTASVFKCECCHKIILGKKGSLTPKKHELA